MATVIDLNSAAGWAKMIVLLWLIGSAYLKQQIRAEQAVDREPEAVRGDAAGGQEAERRDGRRAGDPIREAEDARDGANGSVSGGKRVGGVGEDHNF